MRFRSKLIVTCLGVVLCSVSCQAQDSELLNKTFFISEIFDKYGNNNIITYEGFEHLLENLGLGKVKFERKHDVSIHKINGTFLEFHDELSLHKHSHNVITANVEGNRQRRNLKIEDSSDQNLSRKCLTAQDILTAYGLQPYHDVIISPSKYLQICPAIVYELDQKLCEEKQEQPTREREDRHLVWLCASMSIFVMAVAGMLCVLVVPLAKKPAFASLEQFLISLAVGTLCGDALIHLLPQAYMISGLLETLTGLATCDPAGGVFSGDTGPEGEVLTVLRATLILLAIYFFFIVENLLKGLQNQKSKSSEGKELNVMLKNETREDEHGHHHSHRANGIKTVAWMAVAGDVLHNVTDGLSIGAAFSSSLSSGFASSIAIFCHELPHEMGDYAILLASGMSIKKSLFYNIISSIFSFLGMITGVLLGDIENAALWINAFTAGSFLYIALSDLLPEMKTSQTSFGSFITQTLGLACGGILMFTIALYEDKIESLLC